MEFPHTRKKLVAGGIVALVSVAVILFVFLLGETVGHVKARFACRYEQRTGLPSPSFESRAPSFGMLRVRPEWMPFRGPGTRAAHETAGAVTAIDGATITVDGATQIVTDPDTAFRRGRDRIVFADLTVGDQVSIIGEPDDAGRILARIVLVMPSKQATASSTP